jgi:PadR family transcriptional regulator PadR
MTSVKALRELRRGTVEYCVLALLKHRPMYGFELVRRLEQAGGLATSLGTIYPLLARLRGEGVVSTTLQNSDAGPSRRYYEITPHGLHVLTEFIGEWTRFRTSVDELFAATESENP